MARSACAATLIIDHHLPFGRLLKTTGVISGRAPKRVRARPRRAMGREPGIQFRRDFLLNWIPEGR
jgi:hypothetical protein